MDADLQTAAACAAMTWPSVKMPLTCAFDCSNSRQQRKVALRQHQHCRAEQKVDHATCGSRTPAASTAAAQVRPVQQQAHEDLKIYILCEHT
jgi:hypothetical protein